MKGAFAVLMLLILIAWGFMEVWAWIMSIFRRNHLYVSRKMGTSFFPEADDYRNFSSKMRWGG